MVKQDPNLRAAVDDILSSGSETSEAVVAELIRKRELSGAMMALNEILLEGSPSQKAEARLAVERLGFVAD
ncbi:MAG: hypothetical protein AAF340_01350 [Pseudomonadota bacterium]